VQERRTAASRPFYLSTLVERLFLERSFNSIWAIGRHRLRKQSSQKETA